MNEDNQGAGSRPLVIVVGPQGVEHDKRDHIVKQVMMAIDPIGGTVACLGLTFKADVDDLRESSAVYIIKRLQQEAACELIPCDPMLREVPPQLDGAANTRWEPNWMNGIEDADVVVLLVDHVPFRGIDRRS